MPDLGDGMKVLEELRDMGALRLNANGILECEFVTLIKDKDGKDVRGSRVHHVINLSGLTDNQIKRMGARLNPQTEGRKAVTRALDVAKKAGLTLADLQVLLLEAQGQAAEPAKPEETPTEPPQEPPTREAAKK